MKYVSLAELNIGQTGIINRLANDDSHFIISITKTGITKGRIITRISEMTYNEDESHKVHFERRGLTKKRKLSEDHTRKTLSTYMFFRLDNFGKTVALLKREAQQIIVKID